MGAKIRTLRGEQLVDQQVHLIACQRIALLDCHFAGIRFGNVIPGIKTVVLILVVFVNNIVDDCIRFVDFQAGRNSFEHDGVAAKAFDDKTDLFQERENIHNMGELLRRQIHYLGEEQLLRRGLASLKIPQCLLIKNPLMRDMLIDHDQSTFNLRDDILIVNLPDTGAFIFRFANRHGNAW